MVHGLDAKLGGGIVQRAYYWEAMGYIKGIAWSFGFETTEEFRRWLK